MAMASSRSNDATSAGRSLSSSTLRYNISESQLSTGRLSSLSTCSTAVLISGQEYRRKKPVTGGKVPPLSAPPSNPSQLPTATDQLRSLSTLLNPLRGEKKDAAHGKPVTAVLAQLPPLSAIFHNPTPLPPPKKDVRLFSTIPATVQLSKKESRDRKPVPEVLAQLPQASAVRYTLTSLPTAKDVRSLLTMPDTVHLKKKDSSGRKPVTEVKASSSSAIFYDVTQSPAYSNGLRSVSTCSITMHHMPVGKESSRRKPVTRAEASLSSDVCHSQSQSHASIAGFRSLSIIPTVEDLKTKAWVRPNKVKGAYDSVEDYLDVQFRLLREDVFSPLRDAVEQYLQQIRLGLPVDQLKDAEVYTCVFVIGAAASRWGMTYKIRFDASTKQVKLAQGKHLIFGSQVVLSADNFDTVYVATVQDSNSENTMQGELEVAFEPQYARRILDIEICTTEFVMIETAAYFEAYRHVLEGLKEIQPDVLPFQNYIVECNCASKDPPRYLHSESTYDLSCVAPAEQQCQPRLKNIRVLEPDSWPTAAQLALDQSQFEALQLALTREFAIIQGPPGTGKTFIGLKIVKVLLSNWGKSSLEKMMSSVRISRSPKATPSSSTNSPILVVCYTNHALDQFLEGILEFTPEGVIRVGNRSSSQKLHKCALSKQDQSGVPPFIWKRNREIQKAMQEERQAAMADTHRAMLSDRAIFKCGALKKYMQPNHARQICTINLLDWLSLEHLCALHCNSMDETGMSSAERKAIGEERKLEVEQRLVDAYDYGNIKLRESDKKTLRDIEERETYVNFCNLLEDSKASMNTLKGDVVRLVRIPANSRLLLSKLRSSKPLTADEERRIGDVNRLDVNTRWRLYATWVCRYRNELTKNVATLCHDYDELAQQLRELKTQSHACVLQKAKVIGMTTTGAARMRHVLQRIKPRVVIVEEAAEVLEAHVVTTLSSGCEHVILIGDHQQLRPNPTVHELAKTYKLDVSLFERMVDNYLPFKTLLIQHRMKPEFSATMRNHFYKQLQDSTKVLNREKVRGMKHDMFYLTHAEIEVQDSNQSYCNHHEAKMVVAMCRYLLTQGYSGEKITVLTPYSGQLALIRTKLASTGENICISSVDGYQGEQNDIVLLSTVRSNDKGSLGFMNTPNRICVALSRARLGLYVFGNFKMLARCSRLWRGILLEVQEKKMLGRDMTLACENHRTEVLVRCAEDFNKVSPDGGCQKPCNGQLHCGHPCPKKCHAIPHYMATWKCLSEDRCRQVFKPCEHPCPRRCCDPCPKRCPTKVIRACKCGYVEHIKCYKTAEATLCGNCRNTMCKHDLKRDFTSV